MTKDEFMEKWSKHTLDNNAFDIEVTLNAGVLQADIDALLSNEREQCADALRGKVMRLERVIAHSCP